MMMNHHHHHLFRTSSKALATMRPRISSSSSSSIFFAWWFLLLVCCVRADKRVPASSSQQTQQEETISAKDALLKRGDHYNYYFEHKSVIIPHDEKKFRGGEDAASTSDRLLVVADGVGGWAKHDVNPGLYSRLLTEKVVELGTTKEMADASLVDIVHKANWMAAEEHLGSATCTTLKLTGPKEITTLNIGDSGYSIHRRRQSDGELEVLFASIPGQKRFNYPHQIGGQYGDAVKEVAVEMTHTIEPEDIIVVYSDGVSDNLFPSQFHSCLDNAMDEDDKNNIQSFSLAADCIARQAYFLGKNKRFDSPFAQGARQAGWGNYQGGKHDDITVVVAQIRAGDVSLFVDEDPYFKESITLYKGRIKPVEDLPSLQDLMTPVSGDEL